MSLQSLFTEFNLRSNSPTATVFILISIFVLKKALLGAIKSLRLPPGPKGWPILGNLFDFPTTNQAGIFHKLAAQYGMPSTLCCDSDTGMKLKLCVGDITHFKVLGQHIIVLNTLNADQELLDKRSAIYSDRPPFIMSELYVCHPCFLSCLSVLPPGPTTGAAGSLG